MSVDAGEPRVAFAVGRRVGNAVVRNRLRRRIRAVIAAREAELRPATAYLVGAEAPAAGLSLAELDDLVGACLEAQS